MLSADLILVNGNFITMEPDVPQVQAVAVKYGVIAYAGSTAEALQMKDGETEVIDLRGRTVLPGFIESHAHPIMYGTTLLGIECRPPVVNSIEDLMEQVKAKAAEAPPGTWIRGFGWDDSKMAERRSPTRWDLDKVAPDHPVHLSRTCGHVSVINSKTLELSGIDKDTADPQGGHIVKDPDTGLPTGLMQERAQMLIKTPPLTPDDHYRGMILGHKKLAGWGITTIHEMGLDPTGFMIYQRLLRDEKINVRSRVWLRVIAQLHFKGVIEEAIGLGLQSGFGNDLLLIQGMKVTIDGSVGGKTAAMAEPFEGEKDNRGILYFDEEELSPYVVRCINAGLRVAIHGIGERAIEVALKSFEKAAEDVDIRPMRNRIEHCGLPTDDQLDRIKKLNIIPASSVGFIFSIGDSYYRNLGPERMKRAYPHRTYIDMGIVAPGNSDCPVCTADPMLGIYGAVTRKTVSGQVVDTVQNISVMEAIRAYTLDAAYSSMEENVLGSIKAGKLADMVVLSDNPLKVPAEALKDIQAEMTIMKGKVTHSV